MVVLLSRRLDGLWHWRLAVNLQPQLARLSIKAMRQDDPVLGIRQHPLKHFVLPLLNK